MELEDVEFVEDIESFETESEHALVQVEFLGCCVPGCVDDDFALVACAVEDCQLGGRWWWCAFDAPDAYSVLAFCLDLDIVKYGFDVAVQVYVALQLIQELTLHSVFSHEALFRIMFCNDTGSIFLDLSNAEGDVEQIFKRILVEARKVRPRYVATALDQMTGDERAGELIVVCVCPTIPVPRCTDDLDLSG